MTVIGYIEIWLAFGLINYVIKFVNYRDDWKKMGAEIFCVTVLIAALLIGPVGLLLTLINSRGMPFVK